MSLLVPYELENLKRTEILPHGTSFLLARGYYKDSRQIIGVGDGSRTLSARGNAHVQLEAEVLTFYRHKAKENGALARV